MEVIIISAFADKDYYNNFYKGVKIEDDDLNALLERASDIVRQNSIYTLDDIGKLPSFMQENLKKAVCAQVEFMEMNGGIEAFASGNVSSGTGFSIGKFSMSGVNSSGSSGGISGKISERNSPNMLAYLEAIGFLYRGVGVK